MALDRSLGGALPFPLVGFCEDWRVGGAFSALEEETDRAEVERRRLADGGGPRGWMGAKMAEADRDWLDEDRDGDKRDVGGGGDGHRISSTGEDDEENVGERIPSSSTSASGR